jgi:hypothetical protein
VKAIPVITISNLIIKFQHQINLYCLSIDQQVEIYQLICLQKQLKSEEDRQINLEKSVKDMIKT